MAESFGPISFFSRTYDEAVALLHDAHDYIERHQRRETAGHGIPGQAVAAVETTRLVARLTHVMAWLLVRKAVHAGDISEAEALEQRNRLGGQGICLAEGDAESVLPDSRLARLMDRSRRLYVRVARLDEMLERGAI